MKKNPIFFSEGITKKHKNGEGIRYRMKDSAFFAYLDLELTRNSFAFLFLLLQLFKRERIASRFYISRLSFGPLQFFL